MFLFNVYVSDLQIGSNNESLEIGFCIGFCIL